jgi:hypothetical protein
VPFLRQRGRIQDSYRNKHSTGQRHDDGTIKSMLVHASTFLRFLGEREIRANRLTTTIITAIKVDNILRALYRSF